MLAMLRAMNNGSLLRLVIFVIGVLVLVSVASLAGYVLGRLF